MSEPGTGLLAWLEGVFFGVMELSFLSTPAFAVVALLQSRYPDAVSLSGLAAIGAGSVALAAFRSGRVDVGAWPRRAELSSIPLRIGYFSVVFLMASMGVALVVVTLGSWWLALLGGVVQAAGLAAFPTAYRAVHGEPVGDTALRV